MPDIKLIDNADGIIAFDAGRANGEVQMVVTIQDGQLTPDGKRPIVSQVLLSDKQIRQLHDWFTATFDYDMQG